MKHIVDIELAGRRLTSGDRSYCETSRRRDLGDVWRHRRVGDGRGVPKCQARRGFSAVDGGLPGKDIRGGQNSRRLFQARRPSF